MPYDEQKTAHRNWAVGINLVSSGLAAVIGDALTFPLDVVKVRLQIQGESSKSIKTEGALAKNLVKQSVQKVANYSGIRDAMTTIYREEGARALYGGLTAGLQRQACFSSIRLGFYPSVRDSYARLFAVEEGWAIYAVRIMAGATTGMMSVLFAQPTEVVKIRMQADKDRYKNSRKAYSEIAKKEGVKGMWKGMTPNMMRTIVVNCCEIVTYDIFKTELLTKGYMNDHIGCHFTAAFGAGMVATIIASPIDVVKTRLMNSPPNTYSSTINCAVCLVRESGPRAFYKGVAPSFARLVSWNVVTFVLIEQLRKIITNTVQPYKD